MVGSKCVLLSLGYPTYCLNYGQFGCNTCMVNFYNQVGECKPCSTGCDQCNALSSCIRCLPGYYYLNGICETYPLNCYEVNIDGKCIHCKPYFYMDNDDCLNCPTNCIKCLSSTSCVICDQEYHLSSQLCIDSTLINRMHRPQLPLLPKFKRRMPGMQTCLLRRGRERLHRYR
jgi:hypothetical protein